MTNQLEVKLVEKYPVLFEKRHATGPPLPPIAFGISCGDGWYGILDRLCEKLSALDCGVSVFQVKQKFGGLRFYVDIDQEAKDECYDEVHALIRAAERESTQTCEKCGAEGSPRTIGGWMTTLCSDCAAELVAART